VQVHPAPSNIPLMLIPFPLIRYEFLIKQSGEQIAGGEKMKKRIIVAFMILALIFTIIPMVGTVTAGKGTNKMDFQIHLVGIAAPPPESSIEAGRNLIMKDLPFVMMGDMSTVQIGGETIGAEFLAYEGLMDIQQHLDESGESIFAQVFVNEIYYIYEDDGGEPGDLRGTIVVKALGNNKAGNGGTFVGKGTGEFEGLVIKGVQEPLYPVPNPEYDEITNPDVPETFSALDRIGTAMG